MSFQDTLIAMEALFEFTQVDPNRNVFNILINMEASSTPNWSSMFSMDKSNYTEMQHSYVSILHLWCHHDRLILVCPSACLCIYIPVHKRPSNF